jgi:hypothetical protein
MADTVGPWYYEAKFTGDPPRVELLRVRDIGPTPEYFPSLARLVQVGPVESTRLRTESRPENWETLGVSSTPAQALAKLRAGAVRDRDLAAQEFAECELRVVMSLAYELPPT